MAITKAAINAKLKKTGLPVEIERGDGYIYFIYDDGAKYETLSHASPYLNHHTVEEWVVDGVEFAEAVKEERFDSGTGRIRQRA